MGCEASPIGWEAGPIGWEAGPMGCVLASARGTPSRSTAYAPPPPTIVWDAWCAVGLPTGVAGSPPVAVAAPTAALAVHVHVACTCGMCCHVKSRLVGPFQCPFLSSIGRTLVIAAHPRGALRLFPLLAALLRQRGNLVRIVHVNHIPRGSTNALHVNHIPRGSTPPSTRRDTQPSLPLP